MPSNMTCHNILLVTTWTVMTLHMTSNMKAIRHNIWQHTTIKDNKNFAWHGMWPTIPHNKTYHLTSHYYFTYHQTSWQKMKKNKIISSDVTYQCIQYAIKCNLTITWYPIPHDMPQHSTCHHMNCHNIAHDIQHEGHQTSHLTRHNHQKQRKF